MSYIFQDHTLFVLVFKLYYLDIGLLLLLFKRIYNLQQIIQFTITLHTEIIKTK
jgi:hypothetical protein